MDEEENNREEKEGGIRLLTSGEIELAKSVFISTIQYNKVWIHHGSYLPLGLQGEYVSMAPNGEMYFRYWYRKDFSIALPVAQHTFIHEMSHVWQREQGMSVISRGLLSGMVSYRYKLDERLLNEYSMEQQAQIIADNFSLQREGYKVWSDLRDDEYITLDGDFSEAVIIQQYRKTLRGFPW